MPYQSTPADKQRALLLASFYVLLAIALGYMLFKIWPPVPWPEPAKYPETINRALIECGYPTPTPSPSPSPGEVVKESTSEPVAMPINFFGRCKLTTFDERLLLLVIVAGMLGSFIHGATSLADYIGNNRFSKRWTWFYLLRPVIGMALALVFYFVIRGGFLTTNVGATDINPYGIAALAGLVGMFSKQATDKLSEVFSTLFRSGEGDQKREQPLNPVTKSVLTKIDPAEVAVGSQNLTITVTGTGFVQESIVYLDETPQTTTLENPTQLRVDAANDSFATAGVLKLTVQAPDGTRSDALDLKVLAAPVGPTVANIDPIQVTAGEAEVALMVNGAGFVEGSLVNLNGEPLETTFDSPIKLTANVAPNLIATAGVFKLKVVNPDNSESSEVDFTVA